MIEKRSRFDAGRIFFRKTGIHFSGKCSKDIRTDRLLLRPLRESDSEAIFALFNDWEVVRWLSAPPWPYTREDADAYVRRTLARADDDPETSYVIVRDDAPIGGIGVRMRPASHLQRGDGPNIGYWLGRPYWGNGYMTEAAHGVVRDIFATRTHDAIYSGAFVGNDASLRVQAKLGFVRDGESMLHARPRAGEFPHVNTVLTRARFESVVVPPI